jgi:hypothetical protein
MQKIFWFYSPVTNKKMFCGKCSVLDEKDTNTKTVI